jgi:hypothetical protein
MTTGQPMVELPYARIGGGPRTLVVLEGLSLENKAPSGRSLRLLRWAYQRYTRDSSIYQVARRPGLPAGSTTRDMADRAGPPRRRPTSPSRWTSGGSARAW